MQSRKQIIHRMLTLCRPIAKFGDCDTTKTYDPVKTGVMAVEAVDATAFPNRGAMVVNAEALAVRRAAAR